LLLLLDASFGPIAGVKATGQKLYGDWLDECQVEARFANGLATKIEASWSMPGYGHRGLGRRGPRHRFGRRTGDGHARPPGPGRGRERAGHGALRRRRGL